MHRLYDIRSLVQPTTPLSGERGGGGVPAAPRGKRQQTPEVREISVWSDSH